MDINVELNNSHKIFLSDWDDGGIWFGLSHRYARMHTTMTRKQAEELIDALKKALGQCPKCGSEEWAACKWTSSQGVTPYKEYAECTCGHQWNLE